MKVKILTGLSCAAGSFAADEVVDIAEDVAGSLVKAGLAEPMDEQRTADKQPVTRKATKWQKSDPVSDGA